MHDPCFPKAIFAYTGLIGAFLNNVMQLATFRQKNIILC
ncbi:hypothetical protein Mpsy_2139 [Methanolobus psychrophilus R15]|nr:hypothetical protein Mpsy_2139 [Methanolobus psychrophilus R15]